MITMEPIRDELGNLRPDLDYRDVPLSTMALYLSIHPATLHKRVLRGEVKGVVRHGSFNYFKPRVVIA